MVTRLKSGPDLLEPLLVVFRRDHAHYPRGHGRTRYPPDCAASGGTRPPRELVPWPLVPSRLASGLCWPSRELGWPWHPLVWRLLTTPSGLLVFSVAQATAPNEASTRQHHQRQKRSEARTTRRSGPPRRRSFRKAESDGRAGKAWRRERSCRETLGRRRRRLSGGKRTPQAKVQSRPPSQPPRKQPIRPKARPSARAGVAQLRNLPRGNGRNRW